MSSESGSPGSVDPAPVEDGNDPDANHSRVISDHHSDEEPAEIQEDDGSNNNTVGEIVPLLDERDDGKTNSSDKLEGSQEEVSRLEAGSVGEDQGGAAAASESDNSSSDEGAPPLPEKRPLPDSTEDVSASGALGDRDGEEGSFSSSSIQNSGNEQDNADQTTGGEPAATTPETSTAEGATDESVTVQVIPATSAPNEPPPPYPGGPRVIPGRDPYDGAPGDDRVVLVTRTGNCPKCQVGNIIKNFSFCGICLAIWLFPCGLICLFCMRKKKCSHCGASF